MGFLASVVELLFGKRVDEDGAHHPAPVAMRRDTDADWEEIGRLNPYYGVLTDPKFRTENLTEAARAEFFASGQADIRGQQDQLRARFGAFEPRSALDFGCGVGRLTRALAEITGDAVGVDVSPSMLKEARHSAPEGVQFQTHLPLRSFDWIVSIIVFQHIPPERGYGLLKDLVSRLAPGGCVSLQFAVYRDEALAEVAGGRVAIGEEVRLLSNDVALNALAKGEMVMFDYDLSVIAAILFGAGLHELQMIHTDHGGFHGVMIYGRRPC